MRTRRALASRDSKEGECVVISGQAGNRTRTANDGIAVAGSAQSGMWGTPRPGLSISKQQQCLSSYDNGGAVFAQLKQQGFDCISTVITERRSEWQSR
jgi:hypothetical protein